MNKAIEACKGKTPEGLDKEWEDFKRKFKEEHPNE